MFGIKKNNDIKHRLKKDNIIIINIIMMDSTKSTTTTEQDHHHPYLEHDNNEDQHQKPPPPYEEIQRESSNTLTLSPIETSNQTTKMASESSFKQQQQQLRHSLSIENPMAEVFSNPEFDHVELKIQGHINPVTLNVHKQVDDDDQMMDTKRNKFFFSIRNGVEQKFRQVFCQWKQWQRPEVIAIRLFIVLIALLLMVQLIRVVMPNRYIDDKTMNDSNKVTPLKMYSGRTGKALAILSNPSPDSSLSSTGDVHQQDINVMETKLLQPDQDLIDSLPPKSHNEKNDINEFEKTKLNSNHLESISQENEPDFSSQNIDHDDSRMDEHPTEFIADNEKNPDTSLIHSSSSTTLTQGTSTWTTIPPSFSSSPSSTTKLLPKIMNNSGPTNSNRIQFQTSTTSTTITPAMTLSNNNLYNISIIIHSANVPDMDSGYFMGRASDTYCNVFIDNELVGKTPIIDNSNNPSWHYLLPRQFTVKRETWIRIELMDRDHVRNDHIGGILLNFGDLIKNGSINKPINMFHGRGYIWVTISSVPVSSSS
ncbi:uncharacterized protein LOC113790577 isoform X1 [Dermatophagoides pteronyssinus]|uniref:uncharacterized protein LOC113790577 isoform X1 n=1 Tax=Dermatophagoides pteronyssinus TaxID=6956 RepID=UPI003F672C5C